MNENTGMDYISELIEYLQTLDIDDYKKFMEFALRAPNDIKILTSEILRLRSDVERYREDIKNLRGEVLNREKTDDINRIKANKYDRLVEMLQPTDGGRYVSDVVEAFWKYLRELQYVDTDDTTKPSKAMVEYHLKKVTSIDDSEVKTVAPVIPTVPSVPVTKDEVKVKAGSKRNTPVLDIKRVDVEDGKSIK